MNLIKFAAVSLFAVSSSAFAQVTVDGLRTSATEYAGGSTAVVATDPSAPTSNFGTPGPTATAGYTINLTDQGGSLYGLLSQTGGSAAGAFANLYFDLNPTVGDGSDLGFELGGSGDTATATAFIPGRNGQPGFSTVLGDSVFDVVSTTTNGLLTLEFRLDNSLFTGAISGLIYYDGQTFEPNQTLRLSQSFSYSVAGGETYGDNRLGAFSVAQAAAVPEPATWAMMLIGFGAIGVAMRRRRRSSAILQAA